jgi:hypothetical protein
MAYASGFSPRARPTCDPLARKVPKYARFRSKGGFCRYLRIDRHPGPGIIGRIQVV